MTTPDDLTHAELGDLRRIDRAASSGVARAGDYDPGTLSRLAEAGVISGVAVQVAPTPTDIAGMLSAPAEVMLQVTEPGRALLEGRS